MSSRISRLFSPPARSSSSSYFSPSSSEHHTASSRCCRARLGNAKQDARRKCQNNARKYVRIDADRMPDRMSEQMPARMSEYIYIYVCYIYMPYIYICIYTSRWYVRMVCQGGDHSKKSNFIYLQLFSTERLSIKMLHRWCRNLARHNQDDRKSFVKHAISTSISWCWFRHIALAQNDLFHKKIALQNPNRLVEVIAKM